MAYQVLFQQGLYSAAPKTAEFVGGVYWAKDKHQIGVLTDASTYNWYGGNVVDATLNDSILTITLHDGSPITLNFSDIASASATMEAFAQIDSSIKSLTTTVNNKVDKVSGKGLSTNDFTTPEKNKLAGIEANAQVNTIESISVNGEPVAPDASKNVNIKIPDAVVYEADGTTITQSGSDTVTFSVGAIPQSKVTGLDTSLGLKADKDIIGSGFSASSTVSEQLAAVKTIAETATTPAEVDQKISAAVGSVYKMKGSLTNDASLLALTGVQIGDTYNIINAGTLNDEPFEAGSNFVATKAGAGNQANMWDKLGGTIDLSQYAKTSEVASTYATKTELGDVQTDVTANTSAIATLNGSGPGSVSNSITTAIGKLNKSDAAVEHQFVTQVSESNGIITVQRAQPTVDDINGLSSQLTSKVPTSRTINGYALSTNVILSGDDILVGGDGAHNDSSINVVIEDLYTKVGQASESGVTSFGGATGEITVKGGSASNGSVNLTMSGQQLQASIVGLKSAAFSDATAFATAAQGELASTALQKADITTGTTNGTILVDGTAVAVKGLGSAAYTDSTAYDASGAANTVKTQLIGSSGDASTANTIYGAKKYADSVAQAAVLNWIVL